MFSSSTAPSDAISAHPLPRQQKMTWNPPAEIREKVLWHVLDDLSPRFDEPHIDLQNQFRTGQHLISGHKPPSLDRLKIFSPLRTVSHDFNIQVTQILSCQRDDIAQALVSDALSKILNTYGQRKVVRAHTAIRANALQSCSQRRLSKQKQVKGFFASA